MVARFLIPLIIISAGCTVLKKNPARGNPPGTVQINDTLFIDQIEVANIHWREYLYYLSGVEKNETKYQDALPDTSVWSDLVRKQDTGMLVSHTTNPLTGYYFRHPSYNNYPVVGISYGQALEFCKWRTVAANFSNYIDENHIKNYKDHLNDKFPIKFYYRLPTKKEWEMIAGSTSSNKEGFGERESYSKWRGRSMKSFNCLYPNDKDRADSVAFYTADCKSFLKSSFGCYNMIGNVAEMVSEKGIAKGGSFFHQLDSCKIAIDQKYSHPQAWLGFRCVAVKVK